MIDPTFLPELPHTGPVKNALQASSIPVVDVGKLLTSSSESIIRSWSPINSFNFLMFGLMTWEVTLKGGFLYAKSNTFEI
jgi:hypothetical protein